MNDAAGKREEEEERRGWKGGKILLKAEKRKRRAMYTSPFTAYEWESCCERRRRRGVVWCGGIASPFVRLRCAEVDRGIILTHAQMRRRSSI